VAGIVMLHRQKVLLEFLRAAGRPVGKIELMKWAFLLAHESRSGGGASYYQFVPYHYGPYSFGLDREIQSLAAMGYVRDESNTWVGDTAANPVTPAVMRDVARIVSQYRSVATESLLDVVYGR
jgi:uncharacterized protein YwgA